MQKNGGILLPQNVSVTPQPKTIDHREIFSKTKEHQEYGQKQYIENHKTKHKYFKSQT